MLALALFLRYLTGYLTGQLGLIILVLIRATLLFCFGLSLNIAKHKRYETWVRKVFISFIMIFFVVWEMGYIMIPQLKNFFTMLGFNGLIVYLLYIYCGWSFFD